MEGVTHVDEPYHLVRRIGSDCAGMEQGVVRHDTDRSAEEPCESGCNRAAPPGSDLKEAAGVKDHFYDSVYRIGTTPAFRDYGEQLFLSSVGGVI